MRLILHQQKRDRTYNIEDIYTVVEIGITLCILHDHRLDHILFLSGLFGDAITTIQFSLRSVTVHELHFLHVAHTPEQHLKHTNNNSNNLKKSVKKTFLAF